MGCEDLLRLDRHGFTTPTLHADLRLPQTLLWVLHWLGLVTLCATALGILVQLLLQSNYSRRRHARAARYRRKECFEGLEITQVAIKGIDELAIQDLHIRCINALRDLSSCVTERLGNPFQGRPCL